MHKKGESLTEVKNMNFHELVKHEGLTIEKDKGEHVFEQGDESQSLYFIQSGLLKAYYTSEGGKESVKSFLLPNDVIGSLAAIYSGKSCSFSLVCLETTILQKISFNTIIEYGKKDLNIANDMLNILLSFAIKKEEREFEFLCLSAEERFRKIRETTPTLLDKVTQNDLAHYLGVTPVGLSRIKKRVLNVL